MDSTATLKALLEAIQDGEREDTIEHLENLLGIDSFRRHSLTPS